MLIALLLAACGGEATVTWSTEPCTDWVLGDEPEVTLNTDGEAGLIIAREGVEQPLDAEFAPEVVPDGRVLRIYEAWEGGSEDAETTCAAPTIYVSDLPPRGYTFQWFTEESDAIPEAILEYKL